MIDLKRIKTLFIDGQEVKSLSINNQIVWKKSSGWKGLKIENIRNDTSSIYMYKSNPSSAPEITLMYSLDDGQTWDDFVVCSSSSSFDGTIITLLMGFGVCFKAGEGGNNVLASSIQYNNIFKITGSSNKVSGNINSLLDGENFEEIDDLTGRDYCFVRLFYNSTSLADASELQLPATTMATSCYYNMFRNCSSLTQAPELPATTLASSCYNYMFYNCSSLTQAPELPATTLATNCYSYMFQNCSSLKRIKMNASSGNWGTNMFNGCTSLELVDMTGSTGVPQLSNVNNFNNTNDTYKIVVPDALYDDWILATNWSDASIQPHIMKQSDWNAEHPDDILG